LNKNLKNNYNNNTIYEAKDIMLLTAAATFLAVETLNGLDKVRFATPANYCFHHISPHWHPSSSHFPPIFTSMLQLKQKMEAKKKEAKALQNRHRISLSHPKKQRSVSELADLTTFCKCLHRNTVQWEVIFHQTYP
jgi:hypothetical protein